jgi:hypothetical protein
MLPNFFVIGAAKSGTSSLYHYLRQHPQVYMSPVKEPGFFAFEGERVEFAGPMARELYRAPSLAEIDDILRGAPRSVLAVNDVDVYERLFAAAPPGSAIGEASVLYLPSPDAAARIRRRLPDARLIAVLRHPAERAFSEYISLVMHGREPCGSFEEALAREEERIRAGWAPDWHYVRLGLYAEQLEHYYRQFPPAQIRVYLDDDLRADAGAVCRDVFGFLGVDAEFRPDTAPRHNVSRLPRSRPLARMLAASGRLASVARRCLPRRLRRALRERLDRLAFHGRRPQLAPATRQLLIERFRSDVRRLEALLSRDLSHWLC